VRQFRTRERPSIPQGGRGRRTLTAGGAKNRCIAIAILSGTLIVGLVPTAFPADGPSADLSPRVATLQAEVPVAYDLPVLLAALTELTGWPVLDWPLPRIVQLQPEAFQQLTQLSRRSVFGLYVPETNQVFLNLHCRSQWREEPEVFCRATLFHELVHWGQHHSGVDEMLSGPEEEQQALEYEIRYVETKLGLPDLYPPARPSLDALPPLTMPIRLSQGPWRASIQDVAGQRQWVWVATGTWLQMPAMKRYHGQLVYHDAHWIGVEIFEVDPSAGRQLVEAWWDAGYVPQAGGSLDVVFPVHPTYQGRWVRSR